MKCIKAVKETKNYKVGDILRVSDVEANDKVATTYFQFIPKSEWKLTRVKPETVSTVAETKGEETKSRKAERRSKIKAKQRPSEATDKILK